MISKAQSKGASTHSVIAQSPKLTAVQKKIISLAMLDSQDKVLDLSCDRGWVLGYMQRNMECEVCGISSSMQSVKDARTLLQNADILYASAVDIPWRENSFNAVFYSQSLIDPRAYAEVLRVLKPGGQFLMGVACYPLPLFEKLAKWQREDDAWMFPANKAGIIKMVQDQGFTNVTVHPVNLTHGIVIGWSPMT